MSTRITDHYRLQPRSSKARPRRSWMRICNGLTTGFTTRRTPRSARSTTTTWGRWKRPSADPEALSYEKERAWDARRGLDADRRALVAPLVARAKALRDAIAQARPRPTSSSRRGAPRTRWTSLDLVNQPDDVRPGRDRVCLIAGFLTPLAAVSAAAFLAMIYLSMPPWPGLPPNPKAEGHYLIVSKNLVELIACLVIATTPSGHWIGLDALFFGARRRRRLAARAARRTGTASRLVPTIDRPRLTHSDRRKAR